MVNTLLTNMATKVLNNVANSHFSHGKKGVRTKRRLTAKSSVVTHIANTTVQPTVQPIVQPTVQHTDNSTADPNIDNTHPGETYIGEGGYAKVSKSGEVALKRINWKHLESAVREFAFIKSCSHECIIKILDISAEPDDIVLTMKYYPAVLSTYTIRGLSDVISIAAGLISACKYIHQLGIIHGDIKCDNILVEHGSAPKPILCDFGISLRTDEKIHFAVVQTVTYRAPEVNSAASTAFYTPKIDVWSVGAVLYQLVSGAAMYKFNGSEDSSLYAARFFASQHPALAERSNRKTRLRNLYRLSSTEVLAAILQKFGFDLSANVYRCGLAEVIALSLHPNPHVRSSSSTLFDIISAIVLTSFPEIRRAVKRFGPSATPPAIRHVTSDLPLDELACVVNVPIEVIGSCSQDCLNYAEMLYHTIPGAKKLEISLACIYIASATYCDSNALRAILSLMDIESLHYYTTLTLRSVCGSLR